MGCGNSNDDQSNKISKDESNENSQSLDQKNPIQIRNIQSKNIFLVSQRQLPGSIYNEEDEDEDDEDYDMLDDIEKRILLTKKIRNIHTSNICYIILSYLDEQNQKLWADVIREAMI